MIIFEYFTQFPHLLPCWSLLAFLSHGTCHWWSWPLYVVGGNSFLLALLQVFLFIEYPEDCRRFRQLGKNLTEIILHFPRKLLSAESLSYGGYSYWSNCNGFWVLFLSQLCDTCIWDNGWKLTLQLKQCLFKHQLCLCLNFLFCQGMKNLTWHVN